MSARCAVAHAMPYSPATSLTARIPVAIAEPIFHHTREAIEAHLTIVFAALAVARHLQNETGMSIRKIVATLRPLQQVTLTIAGHEHTAADPLTDPARDIIAATNTERPTH